MGELGGTVEYLYWSTRRTSRFMEDNGLSVQPVTKTLTSPAFGWLPTFSRTTTSASGTRPQIAKVIEGALGQIAVTKFNAPGPIQYAKGVSTVVFGDFMGAPPKQEHRPAVMFTTVHYSRRDQWSVPVCLFGSMDNFLEYIQASGPRTTSGWSSSAAPTVFKFIKSHGRELESRFYPSTVGEVAAAALQIAYAQGTYKAEQECTFGMDRPWQRAYTYGDAREAEWLAQIYMDVRREDLGEKDIEMVDAHAHAPVCRLLIGAPMWIRTPSPRAVRLYANCDDLDNSVSDTSKSLSLRERIAGKFTAEMKSDNAIPR